jgi:hypothetical protein
MDSSPGNRVSLIWRPANGRNKQADSDDGQRRRGKREWAERRSDQIRILEGETGGGRLSAIKTCCCPTVGHK